jgi:hypothetical protein
MGFSGWIPRMTFADDSLVLLIRGMSEVRMRELLSMRMPTLWLLTWLLTWWLTMVDDGFFFPFCIFHEVIFFKRLGFGMLNRHPQNWLNNFSLVHRNVDCFKKLATIY